ncbi:MAG TPA: sensor histidine kinase [Verrucomicrobiae bacterium]|nr:sensor histidine kinase [Verrucomicrobiae bacterium]
MNSNPSARSPDARRALNFPRAGVHLIALVMLADFLGSRLYDTWPNWSAREYLLIVLGAIQLGLYVKRWVLVPLDASPRWWHIYFAGSLACCFVESLIARPFYWLAALYIGQMCAILTPAVSIPASLLALAIVQFTAYGPSRLANRSGDDWIFHISLFVSWMVMGLVIKQIAVISQGRADLIVELAAAKRELKLARDREVEFATLRERERLARALHDNLGHALVTLTVQLEAAQRLLTVDPARAAQLLEEMKTLTRSSTDALRRSLDDLRAPALGDTSLTQALQSLCDDVARRASLKIDCQIAGDADALPHAVAEALWRVAQEGLTNAERHARARQAAVRLDLRPHLVVLRVSDDGLGLPPEAESKPGHYGLRGLREHVSGVGGTLSLTTATPQGTVIEARVPLIG